MRNRARMPQTTYTDKQDNTYSYNSCNSCNSYLNLAASVLLTTLQAKQCIYKFVLIKNEQVVQLLAYTNELHRYL